MCRFREDAVGIEAQEGMLSKWLCGEAHLMIERLIDIRVKDRCSGTLKGEQPQQYDVCPQGHLVLLQYWPFCFLMRLSRSHPVVTVAIVFYWHVFSIIQCILSPMATLGKFNHKKKKEKKNLPCIDRYSKWSKYNLWRKQREVSIMHTDIDHEQ